MFTHVVERTLFGLVVIDPWVFLVQHTFATFFLPQAESTICDRSIYVSVAPLL